MTELQRLGHWATAPLIGGAVQTWYARLAHLLARDWQRQDAAGTFARTLEHAAERALRFAVLWRKLMQGTDNENGAHGVEWMPSVRETCRPRGRPSFPVLVEAVTCTFNGQHPDTSWIYAICPP
jgi:hypothetical protein